MYLNLETIQSLSSIDYFALKSQEHLGSQSHSCLCEFRLKAGHTLIL